MKDNYELLGLPRENHYAKLIKKHGYSVSIHYDTPEEMKADDAVDTIKNILERPGVNSIHLYLKKPMENEKELKA
ncbi:MAG: hypothetical protein FWC89_07095 [Defluviitaleaceae bacterium]|nr:hypothetical protein [Defluviitaleaceae bacterium]